MITCLDDFHTNEVCKFPCSSTTKLLLQAGADPQVSPLKLKHFISVSAFLCIGCGQSKEHSSAHHRDLQEDCVRLPHSARHRDGSPRGWSPHRLSQRGWPNTSGGGNHRGRRDHSQVSGGHVTQVSRSSVNQKIQHQLHWPGTKDICKVS